MPVTAARIRAHISAVETSCLPGRWPQSLAGIWSSRCTAAAPAVARAERADQIAGNLSYGHQRLLEVAMGLALSPRVLILDEPTQGLAAGEIAGFVALIRSLVPQTTVLLIEHNMEVVMGLADRITVLNFGQVLAEGTPVEVRANPAVQAAYLGGDDAAA